jgi:hypothetical protein
MTRRRIPESRQNCSAQKSAVRAKGCITTPVVTAENAGSGEPAFICSAVSTCAPLGEREASANAKDHYRTVEYSCIVRRQALRHSDLVICVPRSQKPMQSSNDLPPPPGVLRADWLLWLAPGERAKPLLEVVPPF